MCLNRGLGTVYVVQHCLGIKNDKGDKGDKDDDEDDRDEDVS